ncbi:hypothetical protein [Aporhodopirellula aestuarii]|uniref:Secreted protein n=1 Tax=Aporhodopirellula aestuarii TaxID=2950107 RepID=A0ABT0U895_9BACT|nr:hypothetical protein [Aporhodopirellula aestuarii]MCM2373139.1 hypothetical protein [Aporhodopirellula aestuarii]
MKKFPRRHESIFVALLVLSVVGCGGSGASTSPDKGELERFLDSNPDLRDNDMTVLDEDPSAGVSNADIEAELRELGDPGSE